MTADRSALRIRPMRLAEIEIAVDWAAREGWNPGFADAQCFATVDPDGFFIGELDGEPAAVISNINYDDSFAFLGFYIVRPDLRGRGYGLQMWKQAIAHAGARTIGLDGVVAQQPSYRKSGFILAYNNVRYSGRLSATRPVTGTIALAELPAEVLEADDATVFPAPRANFLRSWVNAPGHIGRALMDDDKLTAWGVARPCRRGCKIAPLVANHRQAAEAIVKSLVGALGTGEFSIDAPQVNPEAIGLAQSLGLRPVFETARMYIGPVRALQLDRLYGVTSFELG